MSSSLKLPQLLWALCLALALFVLTTEAGHAHEDSPPIAVMSITHDDAAHAAGVMGHCHGGATCGISAILGLTDNALIQFPGGRDVVIRHHSLSNLVSHGYEPPPPRSLS